MVENNSDGELIVAIEFVCGCVAEVLVVVFIASGVLCCGVL